MSARLSTSAARRSLTDARSGMTSFLDDTREGVGLDTERQRTGWADELAIEPHVEAAGVDLSGGHPPLLDARVRQVGSGGQPATGLQAVTGRHRDLERVEQPVVRMSTGRHVPPAEILRVHRDVDATAPPTPAHDEMGDEPMQPSIDQGCAEVDGELHGVGGAQAGLVTSPADRA